MTKPLYSTDDIRKTYEIIHDHKFTKDIIIRYSQNNDDIRAVALEGLDLSHCRSILDLGCGYGLFIERLKGRIPTEAMVTGLDVLESNRPAFLHTLEASGFKGTFIKGGADLIRTIAAASFDLIIASYSLYFFPHLIADIARVLKNDGIFITITHSRFSLKEITDLIPLSMAETGIDPPPQIAITSLLNSFALENGRPLLQRHFRTVDAIRYPNTMVFPASAINDCIHYLTHKRHLLFKEVADNNPEKMDDVQTRFYQRIHHLAHSRGSFTITKDDAVFRCFHPRRNHAMDKRDAAATNNR